jgi:hypothetical protein
MQALWQKWSVLIVVMLGMLLPTMAQTEPSDSLITDTVGYVQPKSQRSFGLRFASDLNYFNRANDYSLAKGLYTTGVFGIFYRSYNRNGGFEAGLNVNYKNNGDKGFPNFPVVMADYPNKESGDSLNVGNLSFEACMMVGPRFGPFNPRLGYVLGYRARNEGYLKPSVDTLTLQNWYFTLPFGLTFDVPTGFGSVGFGALYNINLLNVVRKPVSYTLPGFYDGGKLRNLRFEITVTLNNRD